MQLNYYSSLLETWETAFGLSKRQGQVNRDSNYRAGTILRQN